MYTLNNTLHTVRRDLKCAIYDTSDHANRQVVCPARWKPMLSSLINYKWKLLMGQKTKCLYFCKCLGLYRCQVVPVCIFPLECVGCWCKYVYSGLITFLLWTPTVWPSPRAPNWPCARTLTCCSCSASLPSAVLHSSSSAGVTEEFCPRWAWDPRTQSHLFTGTTQMHQALKEPPFDRGEPWKLALATKPTF